jgi:hypothetical protein
VVALELFEGVERVAAALPRGHAASRGALGMGL